MMRVNVWRQRKGSVCVKILAHATPLHTGMRRNDGEKIPPSIPFGSACDGTEIPSETQAKKPKLFKLDGHAGSKSQ